MASKTEDKVLFDLYSEARREFVAKYYAYAIGEVVDELHRGHCYRVQFNSNPKHPMIEAKLEEVHLQPAEASGKSNTAPDF